jgi:hypothetical protein
MKPLFLAILILSATQVLAQKRFEIIDVYAQSAYDAAYVSSLATQFLPVTRESYPVMIKCLKSELMTSGMFSDIRTRLDARSPGVYHLVITPTWKGNPDKYLIKEILVDDSFGARLQAKLMSKVSARGVNIGVPFSYTAITRSIGDAANDLEESGENKVDVDLWVRAKLMKRNEIRLVISKKAPICNSRDE